MEIGWEKKSLQDEEKKHTVSNIVKSSSPCYWAAHIHSKLFMEGSITHPAQIWRDEKEMGQKH